MKKCARCKRKIKYPVLVAGKYYGSTCAQKIGDPRIQLLENKIKSLERQLSEIEQLVNGNQQQNRTMLPKVPQSKLSKVPGNGNPLTLNQNYGKNHGELISELKNVLKERKFN